MSSHILVVEDESMIAQDLQEMLSSYGYQVPLTVDTGKAAIAAIQKSPPDLILMDIRLKGDLSGIQTASEIKTLNPSIAVLYLTSYTDHQTLQEAKATEPLGYILKPFREKELLAMIEIALYRQATEKQAQKKQELFKHLLQMTSDAIIILDDEGHFEYLNDKARQYFSLTSEHERLKIHELKHLKKPESQSGFMNLDEFLKGSAFLVMDDHHETLYQFASSPLMSPEKVTRGYSLTVFPVDTLDSVISTKQLHICASCKQIRDHQGNYDHFEPFFRRHYNLNFSHGMCPACFSELYPKYYQRFNETGQASP